MNIAQQRQHNHRIGHNKLATAEAVVRYMGAVQAQDYNQALWGMGARIENSRQNDVETAIEAGRILRTWPMRGTIHFVPAEDTRWMLDLCASRQMTSNTRRLKRLDMSESDVERCAARIHEVLTGGKRLTRADLLASLDDIGIPMDGQRGYHILYRCAHDGLICIGPNDGKQQTFALLDEWAGQQTALTREEALAELVLRYVRSHGPVTEKDFARWSGLTLTDTRRGMAMNESQFTSQEVEGVTYWSVPLDHTPGSETQAHLLAGFDEYVIGYKDRDDVMNPNYMERIVPGNNGIFRPIIIIDGRVVGTWKRKLRKQAIYLTLDPFETLSKNHMAAVEAASEDYSQFMGLPIDKIEWATL